MGASGSLPPMSITESLGISYNPNERISVREADGPYQGAGDHLVTVSGENFLLSNADLKNLSLLAADFPSYLGRMRKEVLG